MNARARIYLLFVLLIGIIFLIIAINQQQIVAYRISDFTDPEIKNILAAYVAGFPTPW